MRKIVLYIAMSLDGYIADAQGGVAWLEEAIPADAPAGSYEDFIQTIDTIILGRTTYDQIVEELFPNGWPYEDQFTYVMTHRLEDTREGCCFTDQPLRDVLQQLRQQDGKDIWICGGADIVNQAIKEGLIDRYWITVMPVILGTGIPLFYDNNPRVDLVLKKIFQEHEMMHLIYEAKH